MNTFPHNMSTRKVQLLLTIAGLTGVVSLFLPFTFGISPLAALSESDLWQLGAPAFLAFLVSSATLRWILADSFSRIEKVGAYLMSAVSASLTLSVIFPLILGSPSGFWEIFTCVLPVVVLILGAWLVISKIRKKLSKDYCPVIAIQVAYIAHCLMLLVALFVGWQIGAWFSLATVVIYLLQIYLFSTQKDEISDHGQEAERSN